MTDGRMDKAAALCSPFGEHKNNDGIVVVANDTCPIYPHFFIYEP